MQNWTLTSLTHFANCCDTAARPWQPRWVGRTLAGGRRKLKASYELWGFLLCLQGEAILVAAVEESPAFAAKDWSAAFISQRQEFEYEVDGVEGTIPAFLRGTLFRNGPGNFGAPSGPGKSRPMAALVHLLGAAGRGACMRGC